MNTFVDTHRDAFGVQPIGDVLTDVLLFILEEARAGSSDGDKSMVVDWPLILVVMGVASVLLIGFLCCFWWKLAGILDTRNGYSCRLR